MRIAASSISMVIVLVFAASHPARAQSRVYVSGDVFAEVTKLSRTTVTPPEELGLTSSASSEGVTAGGGARVGAFFSPAWSLELGVDLGRTIADMRAVAIRLPANLRGLIPSAEFESRSSNRFSATSVLIGYHPPVRGRVHPGFRGGLSLMHIERTSTSANISSLTLSPSLTIPVVVPVPTLSVVTSEIASSANVLTATIAAEAAIDVSAHFAVVPEMRVHAGGLGGFVLRPGVAARWIW